MSHKYFPQSFYNLLFYFLEKTKTFCETKHLKKVFISGNILFILLMNSFEESFLARNIFLNCIGKLNII